MILRGNLARHLRSTATFEGEGVAGGGAAVVKPAGDPAPAADPAKPAADPVASVLFPKEGEPKPAAGDPPKEGDKPKAEDWKEYVADPAKSEADNATAKAAHDKTKPAAADPADTVPADGKYTLAMPEGVEVNKALLDKISPRLAAKGYTQREAQALADDFVAIQKEQMEQRTKAWGETVNGWVDQAKADKEIGGDKWDGTVTTAMRAVNQLGTPALKDYLEATGGGNHPELIRFMAKVGAMIKEDNPANGGAGGSGNPAEAAHVLFPNDAPKG